VYLIREYKNRLFFFDNQAFAANSYSHFPRKKNDNLKALVQMGRKTEISPFLYF
jgi:hypothetical protein